MPLIPPLSQAAADLALLDALILQTAEAANHLAATMSRCNSEFWSLPDDRLAAVLNNDVARTAAVFASNSALGVAVNAALDAIDSVALAARAPVSPGRELRVDDQGAFVVVPLPAQPEVAP